MTSSAVRTILQHAGVNQQALVRKDGRMSVRLFVVARWRLGIS